MTASMVEAGVLARTVWVLLLAMCTSTSAAAPAATGAKPAGASSLGEAKSTRRDGRARAMQRARSVSHGSVLLGRYSLTEAPPSYLDLGTAQILAQESPQDFFPDIESHFEPQVSSGYTYAYQALGPPGPLGVYPDVEVVPGLPDLRPGLQGLPGPPPPPLFLSPPGHPAPPTKDQKLEISLGPCVLQLHEPCTDDGKIIFYLFRSVDGRPDVLSINNPILPEDFDPSLPTKVLIHGFAGSVDFNFTASVRQAYLLRGGYNVLVVDWGRLTQLPCYPSSVLNTWQVARCAGLLLAQLGRLAPSLQAPSLHVVGFSLGAHIAAYLSAELQARTGQRLARITGLDPALPAFASLSSSWKLDASDADFVDVVHTNAGVLGKIEPTGHADFYVNGGSVQPFCTGGDRNIPLCSHLLAPVYFSETVLDEASHWGRQCSSYGHYAWGWCPGGRPSPEQAVSTPGAFMGEGADPRIRGTFLVETAAEYPFALGPPIADTHLPQPPNEQPETIFVVLSRLNQK